MPKNRYASRFTTGTIPYCLHSSFISFFSQRIEIALLLLHGIHGHWRNSFWSHFRNTFWQSLKFSNNNLDDEMDYQYRKGRQLSPTANLGSPYPKVGHFHLRPNIQGFTWNITNITEPGEKPLFSVQVSMTMDVPAQKFKKQWNILPWTPRKMMKWLKKHFNFDSCWMSVGCETSITRLKTVQFPKPKWHPSWQVPNHLSKGEENRNPLVIEDTLCQLHDKAKT